MKVTPVNQLQYRVIPRTAPSAVGISCLLAVLLSTFATVNAAELAWPADHSGDQPPAGWTVTKSAESKGSLRFEQGRLLLTGEIPLHHHLSRELGVDGSDAAPLVVSARIATDRERDLGGMPTCIALYWKPDAVLLIGPGGWSEWKEGWEPWRRRAWSAWINGPEKGKRPAEWRLYSGNARAHFRIVLTGRDLTAYASADGLRYEPLVSFAREGSVFAGPPQRVIVGRGWVGEKPEQQKPLLANDVGDLSWKDLVGWSVEALSITTDVPKPPRARLSKAKTWDDLRETELAAGAVTAWQVLGPLPQSDKPYGPETAFDPKQSFRLSDGKDGSWRAFTPDANRRAVDLKAVLKIGGDNQVSYAAATITSDAARDTTLWFDGAKGIQVFAGGRLVGERWSNWEMDLLPDRNSAIIPLAKGDNTVVLRLTSGWDGNCRFAFRHDAVPPLQRIADLKQAIADLTDDADGVNAVAAWLEIARRWEGLGRLRQAGEALGEALARENLSGEQVDQLSFARARVYRLLRDRDAVIAVVEELAKRRITADAKDAGAAQLKLARLWEQMGFPERAAAAIGQALAVPQAAPDQLADALLERARLRAQLKQEAEVAGDLRELARRLPAADPLRNEAAFQAFALDLAAGKADAAAFAAELAKETIDRAAKQARLHALLAAAAEAKGDAKARAFELTAMSGIPGGETAWGSLRVELAEALIAAAPKGDEAAQRAAAEQYRLALAAAAGADHPQVAERRAAAEQQLAANKPGAALQAMRAANARAALVESAAGERLLQQALAARPADIGTGGNVLLSPLIRDWHVIGPFDNANWQCYEKPPVASGSAAPGRVDVGKEIQGKRWLRPGVDAYREGILELNRLFNGQQNCVAVMYREIDVAAAFDGQLAIGCDDGLTVWLNGRKLHEDRDSRGVVPGQIKLPARFEKGTNALMVMVQQGNGDWGLHLRVDGGPAQSAGLAQFLALVEQVADNRGGLATGLMEVVDTFANAGQAEEAAAVARLLIRALPDNAEAQLAAGNRLITGTNEKPRVLRQAGGLVAWMHDAAERRGFAGRDAWLAAFRPRAARILVADGELEPAALMLRRVQLTDLGADAQTRVLADLGDLYRAAGYPREAAEAYRKAGARPISDDTLRRQVQDGLFRVRSIKADGSAFALSLDGGTLAQTADRAAASGDLERAVRSYQRAIDQHGGGLMRLDAGRVVGVAEYCADRLRALGGEGLAAYRKLVDNRANDLFKQAEAALDADAFARLVQTYPLSSAAAPALSRLADLALDAGDGLRAAQVIDRLLPGANGPAKALLLARRALACEVGGDLPGARATLDRLAKECAGTELTVRGRTAKAEAWADERRKALETLKPGAWSGVGGGPLRTGAGPALAAPAACRVEVLLPVHPAERIAADRFAPSPFRSLLLDGASDGRSLYVHTLDEAFAIDLATGALRWRGGGAFPELRRGERQDGFSGNASAMTAAADGRVFVRGQRRASTGRVFAIECRSAADGSLLWSSEDASGAADASAISSPAVADGRVIAVFHDRDERFHNAVVAFAAADGRVLWRTPLADGAAGLQLSTQQEISLAEHLAAPSIAGGDVYVSTDLGAVAALDVGTGAVRWAATYPRALLDPALSRATIRLLANRAASRVVVGPELIHVIPRDTLAVLAIARANGEVRWRRELSPARALLGLADGVLVTQDEGLTALDAATGSPRWSWAPERGAGVVGVGVIAGGSVHLGTAAGLARVALADGRLQGLDAWSRLGVEAPLGNFLIVGDALVGFGSDRMAVLGAAGGAKARSEVPWNAVGEAAISSSGLPAAPFSQPLALRWRLGDGADNGIQRAEGGDETYLDLNDRLVKLDAGAARIVWSAPIAPGALRLVASRDLVLAVYPRSVVAIDPATGRTRWTHAVVYDDAGFFLDRDEDERKRERFFDEVSASPAAVAVRRRESRQVELLDPRSGAIIATVPFAGSIRWTAMAGDLLLVAVQAGERLVLEARTTSGQTAWTRDWNVGRDQRHFAAAVDGARGIAWLASDRQLVAVDLAKKQDLFTQGVHLGDYASLRLDGGVLVLSSRRDNNWTTTLLDPASGKPVMDETQVRGDRSPALSRPLIVGDRVIVESGQRNGHRVQLVCRSLAGGKELWSTDLGETHHRRFLGQAVVERSVVLISYVGGDPRLRYTMLDLDSGKVTGGGDLPGYRPANEEKILPVLAAGGQLLYGNQQGVIAVGGLPAPPAGRRPLDGAIDQLRAAARQPSREAEGAGEFLATYAPDTAPALYTAAPPRTDGQFDGAASSIAIDRPADVRLEPGARWAGAGDCSARARVLWDERFIHVAVAVVDDDHRPVPAGGSPLDGDALLIGIDPDGANTSGEDRQPLVLSLALVDGQPRLTQFSGRAVQAREGEEDQGRIGDDDRASVRIVRSAAGVTYELALPWVVVRPNANERPGWKATMGIDLAVIDRDAGQSKAMEWGSGLVRGINPKRFGQVTFIGLTPERIASFRRFTELMPAHEFAWRFVQRIAETHLGQAGLPGRIAEIESFIKANPTSVHAATALGELAALHLRAGSDRGFQRAAEFGAAAGVGARAIGDAAGPGPASRNEGRALRQWVWLDPQRPPLELMLMVRTRERDYNQRAFWGDDLIRWGEAATTQRRWLGPLPATGQWVPLTIPIAVLGLNEQTIDNLSFVVHGGTVWWGRSEFVDGGKTTALIDGAAPKGIGFDKGVQWTDQPSHDGKKSHGPGPQGGEHEYHLRNNEAFVIDLKSPAPAQGAEATPKERLARNVQAAKLIPETEEALHLLWEAAGWHEGQEPQRSEAILATYADFLKSYPANRMAYRPLSQMREMLEGWTQGKDPAKRAAAVARIEKLMDEVKLGREQRRLFYAEFAPTIMEWRLAGWFDPGRGPANLHEALPPERGAFDVEQTFVGARDREIAWIEPAAEWKYVNVGSRIKDKEKRRYPVAYLATRFESPVSGDLLLHVGLRGQALVWVNGKRVGGVLAGDRDFRRDALAVPIKLVKGSNEILVKIVEREGNALLSCRIGDVSGRPLDGLVVRLPPTLAGATADAPGTVTVRFSGVVQNGEVAANYALDREVKVTAVALAKDKRSAALSVAPPLAVGVDHVLTVSNLTSVSGTPIRPGSVARLRLTANTTSGGGLKAEFFEGRDFAKLLTTRTDPVIDFAWEDNAEVPDPAVPHDNFCVRWSGQVQPTVSDTWTFTTLTDDGVRLWVDGKQIIDQWSDQAATEVNGTAVLEAGKRYDIRMEYYQGGSAAVARLMWSCSKVDREVIPASQLFPGKAAK